MPRKRRSRAWFLAVALAAALFVWFFREGVTFFTDWLWFREVGYTGVFFKIFLTTWAVRGAVVLVYFLFLYINLRLVGDTLTRAWGRLVTRYPGLWRLDRRRLHQIILLLTLVLAFFTAVAVPDWEVVQRFLNAQPFGVTDPIFGQDLGFYVFDVPFYQFLYTLLISLQLLTLIMVTAVYVLGGTITFDLKGMMVEPRVRGHLAVLVALFCLTKGFGYWLDRFQILYSPQGVVFGAGYTDVHVQMPGLLVLAILAGVTAVLALWGGITRRIRPVLAAAVLLLGGSLLVGNVYPGLVQKFMVEPNELELERPYIKHAVQFTRYGFGLDEIEEFNYPAREDLRYEEVIAETGTVENIRVWDWRPLLASYNQLQSMRLYYDFSDVDVDRYILGGRLQQVAISARELNIDRIPARAQTWVNQKLKYTHGYGVVMSSSTQITSEGLPAFIIRDVPPVGPAEVKVTRPEIYYGEMTRDYVIAPNRSHEFDYPRGDDNAYSDYEGTGGVPLKNWGTRVLFALRFNTLKMLLSTDITADSRILFRREILPRVKAIAPFLKYDGDPYIVLDQGKLFWVIDAYVRAETLPYSDPELGWGNYVRNSVKVTVDAYNGKVTFYAADPKEPLLRSYSAMFPGMFRPLAEMPAGLRDHIRYPQDFFALQSRVYMAYHMKDPTVFYNREDAWDIPEEIFGAEKVPVEPYYVIMRLPDTEKDEFLMLLPFSPARKGNMVAWMAAISSGSDYGRVVVYKFPKEKLTFGPIQVEARIDQDQVISQALTLWNQRGSNVIRGNLLVVPIRGGVLYVEPLYLQAVQSQLPELKQVIVAYNDRVVMDKNLDTALARVFQKAPPSLVGVGQPTPVPTDARADEILRRVAALQAQAETSLRKGDWTGFGAAWAEIGQLLQDFQR